MILFCVCKQLAGLGHRQAGQRGRHVEQRAFVQGRHKLRPDTHERPERDREHGDRDSHRQHARIQHGADDRAIECDQRRG